MLTARCAVCDTGPMISVLQSSEVELIKWMYDRIYIPESTLSEYCDLGVKQEIEELISCGFVVVCELSESEKLTAKNISEEVANHYFTKDKNPENHYPEAEAIVLTLRKELNLIEIILDELAAREVAKKHGIAIVGYAGLLIRACRKHRINPEEVRKILFRCQSQGTNYATKFIKGIYEKLKEELE